MAIRAKVEACVAFTFNSVLVNLYRNGLDYVGWHADDEPELGTHPFIVSLTLGAERAFEFRHKQSFQQGRLSIPSGTLLMMQPDFQHHWLHSVPVAPTLTAGRINLTFRKVIPLANAFAEQ